MDTIDQPAALAAAMRIVETSAKIDAVLQAMLEILERRGEG